MADILRYGAYLPRYRAPLKEIQSFYGRPGRPRSRALCTPALDEDTLTMAYEASVAALAGAEAPGAVITVSQSPPFGLRKLSATLARTLGLDGALPIDVGGHAGSLLDALEIAGALAGEGNPPALVVASDHLVSYEDRVCDTLSAGAATAFLVGASGGFARLGATARAAREVYDVWRLGTEPEARYRLEVLFDAYGATTTRGPRGPRAPDRAAHLGVHDGGRQPAPPPDPEGPRPRGRRGGAAGAHQLRRRDRQPGRGLGRASPWRSASTGRRPATTWSPSATAAARRSRRRSRSPAPQPSAGTAEQIPGEAIDLSTYYRWTRGRQAEPH